MAAAVPCPDGVEADVEVEAVSADGALAETARGLVFSESPKWAYVDVLLHRPPMGTLRIDAAPSSGLRFRSLSLSLDFVQGTLYGALYLILGDGSGAPNSWTVLTPAMLRPVTTTAAASR